MTALLEYHGVEAAYGKARILHDLSFAIAKGASVAILGRNGVGKTTVVNTLFGIAQLVGGSITLAGRTLQRLRPYTAARAGVSVVVQGRGILHNLTVRENLLLGAATRRPGPWNLDRVFDLYPVLHERADTPGTALSGGQQQMLALGRGLMANPDLLVLDEPSEGLAPVIVDELAAVLNRLRKEGTTLLLIEQNLSLVERVSETYYVLSKGHAVEHGFIAATGRAELQKHIAI